MSGSGGQIRQRSNGLWKGRYVGADRRRHSGYGKTKRAAQERLRSALTAADPGIRPTSDRITVAAWLDEWLSTSVAQRCRPATIRSYRSISDFYIISAIADLYAGTVVLLVAGAILWGARIADFTMFYLFFAGIAVIATPVAAIAVRDLWEHLRATRHLRLAFGLVVLCVVQLDFGVVAGIIRLQSFGPYAIQPSIPVKLLDAIRRLPSNAELAYACQPFEEVAFGTPRLISIDAHTSRRVVPMCFTAEVVTVLTGGNMSDQVPSLYFQVAPQRALYPNVTARPSSAAVTVFLRDHGIDYIYADSRHPNSLVDDAIPIVVVGDFEILRIP